MPTRTALEAWTASVIPIGRRCARLPFACRLDAADMARVRQGLLPPDTDERWFIVLRDDGLALCRAHGGHQIYRLPLRAEGLEQVAGPLVVQADPRIHRRLGDDHDIRTVTLLLQRLLQRDLA